MGKTVFYNNSDIDKYAGLTETLQLEDLTVVGQHLDKEKNTLFLYCTHRFDIGMCKNCGEICTSIHDYPTRRVVNDAPIRGYITKLVFDSRRLKCPSCQAKFVLNVRDVVPNCTYTFRLAQYISDPSRKQDAFTLAKHVGIGYKMAADIIKKATEMKLEEREKTPIKVKQLGIDEIKTRKGHNDYVLVLTDLERRIILDILPDRLKGTLLIWLKKPKSGVDLSELEYAATDLWQAYKNAVLETFENVKVVADRFHVMQAINKVIDEERRKAQKKADDEEEKKLKGLRYTLRKNKSRLTEEEQAKLDALRETYPHLYQLWALRQDLRDMYEKDLSQDDAKIQVDEWLKKAKKLGLSSLNTFCETLEKWKQEVLNFWLNRITSGFVEGMNSKIRFFRHLAFGFPNFASFRLRMIWACG